MVQNGEVGKIFRAGQVPTGLEGIYLGKVNFSTNWQGKAFDATASGGINIFWENGESNRYIPFKTYSGYGLLDPETRVLKIDYDLSVNPWWVRMILDELVEVSPGNYLGKLILKTPWGGWALGYFELQK